MPDVLGVFVKAPVAGRVKTRLAADVGPRRAARLYRGMGREIVARCVRPEAYRTVIWFSPPGAQRLVRTWLGGLPVSGFAPQRDGGLGVRLSAALGRHFGEGARRVVVIGSDCPHLERGSITRAFAALDVSDVVIGPAGDGGFYLLGLRAPAAGLFRGVAWSTASVGDQTLANAERLGLACSLLPTLRDVDTVADARALGLIGGLHPRG